MEGFKMEDVLKSILKDDFVPYEKVYQMASNYGLSKAQVRKAKEIIGVKTVTLVRGDERIWLWYIPDNVWKKYAKE